MGDRRANCVYIVKLASRLNFPKSNFSLGKVALVNVALTLVRTDNQKITLLILT